MRPVLIVVKGNAKRSRVSVGLPVVIGRSRQANLTIPHSLISRMHCELYEENGVVMIRDLGSLNGIQVGGAPVSQATLLPNDQFTVGPLTFRIEYDYQGPPNPERVVIPPEGVDQVDVGGDSGLKAGSSADRTVLEQSGMNLTPTEGSGIQLGGSAIGLGGSGPEIEVLDDADVVEAEAIEAGPAIPAPPPGFGEMSPPVDLPDVAAHNGVGAGDEAAESSPPQDSTDKESRPPGFDTDEESLSDFLRGFQ